MKTLALAVVMIAVLAGAGAYAVRARLETPFRRYAGESQLVEIPAGASSRSIGERLAAAGVVRDRMTFRVALWLSGNQARLQAGEYRFDRPMTPGDVIAKIARGEVDQLFITFPEGLTVAEMARIFEERQMGTAAAFVQAAGDASAVRSLDPVASDLEGYLFPDTYALPRRAPAAMLVRAMTDRFLQELSPAIRQAAAAQGRTIRQLVTLASIVEKETARADERPRVAGVYANRLRIGMALQCDPTVIYALQRAGRYTGNLTRNDLRFDSPYNTYRYPGLPPGPIASPGRAALQAAANPAPIDALYFVSRNDGSHEFSRTLEEHNRRVRQYQVQYFRERRLAARRP